MSDNKSCKNSNLIKALLREPLVHFLVIGALFFLSFHLWGRGGPDSNLIVITSGQIDTMVMRFSRTWQRSPTEKELKGLIDDHVRGEIASREAMAMGLDRDDAIIQRRLRQKIEFMAEGAADAAPPTEAELRAWFNEHVEKYRIEPEIEFYQVYLNPDKRGDSIVYDAKELLEQLRMTDLPVDINAGDPLMVPNEMKLSRLSSVSRVFGKQFADEIYKIDPGHWAGPVSSSYGLHIVYVTKRRDGRIPTFAEVQSDVERDFTSARRKEALKVMYQSMLERYNVKIEASPEQAADRGNKLTAASTPDKGDS